MRVRDPNDRRVVRIHLLEIGKKMIDEVIQKRQGYLQDVLVRFSADEVVNLKDSLSKLHHDMRKE